MINSFQIGARKIIATTNKKLGIQIFRLVGETTFPVIDIQIPLYGQVVNLPLAAQPQLKHLLKVLQWEFWILLVI